MADLSEDLAIAFGNPRVQELLQGIVKRAMISAVRTAEPTDRLIDAPEAARMLGMSVAAVRKAAIRGAIPCVRLGRRVRFRPTQILATAR